MRFLKCCQFLLIFVVLFSLVVLGCTTKTPKMPDRSFKGPQVVINPQEVPLGVASLMGMEMIIEGAGFRPQDTVLIWLIGEKDIKVPITNAKVGEDGTFSVKFGKSLQDILVKVSEILRASMRTNEKSQTVLVITQEPIPKGSYKLRAENVIEPQMAETPVELVDPPFTGRIKDRIGKMLGKIEDKR